MAISKDPVCGMGVNAGTPGLSLERDGTSYSTGSALQPSHVP